MDSICFLSNIKSGVKIFNVTGNMAGADMSGVAEIFYRVDCESQAKTNCISLQNGAVCGSSSTAEYVASLELPFRPPGFFRWKVSTTDCININLSNKTVQFFGNNVTFSNNTYDKSYYDTDSNYHSIGNFYRAHYYSSTHQGRWYAYLREDLRGFTYSFDSDYNDSSYIIRGIFVWG